MRNKNKISFLSKIFFSLLLLAAAGLYQIDQALAIEYGALGGRPANPDPAVPNSGSWFIYNLNAGEKKEDAILVSNMFDEEFEVLVYAADTLRSSSGGFALRQFSEPKEKTGLWVRFYPDAAPQVFEDIFEKKKKSILAFCQMSRADLGREVFSGIQKDLQIKKKLQENPDALVSEEDFASFESWCRGTDHIRRVFAAKEKIEIPFVFSVPEKVDVGEHTGGILIQKVAAEDGGTANGSAVKLTMRVGVRIYETVPGEVVKKISLDSFGVNKNFKEFDFSDWFGDLKKPREYLVETRISNDGNVSIEHNNNLRIKDLWFNRRTEEVERKFQVLSRDKFAANYAWKKPFFGKYSFQAEVKYASNDGEQVLTSDPVTLWIIPWREMAIGIFLLAALLAAYYIWKIRYKKKYGGIGWVEYEIGKNDTLASLAQKCGADWKILAKTNKIKAPFILGEGQVIRVPSLDGLATKKEKVEATALEGEIDDKEDATEEPELITDESGVPEEPKLAAGDKEINKLAMIRKIASKKDLQGKVVDEKLINKKILFWIVAGVLLILTIVIAAWMIVSKAKNQTVINEKISINSVGGEAATQAEKLSDNAAKEKEEKIDIAQISLKVLNEGATPGSAGKIKDFLIEKGYAKAEAGNGEKKDFQGAVVFYGEDKFKTEADWIKEMLAGKKIKAETKEAVSDEEKSADIVIILGK